jgi:TolB-like protein
MLEREGRKKAHKVRKPKPFLIVPAIIGLLILSSCATYRSDFQSIGEETHLTEDFKKDLFAWRIRTDQPQGFEQVQEDDRSYLRLKRPGGAYLDRSALESFRMEFDLRVEAPIEDPFSYAMINFKNFFNKRYVLLVEPTVIQLLAAKVKHNQPVTLVNKRINTGKNRWNHFEIVNVKDVIKVFINDQLIIDYKERKDPIQLGNIWFESHSQFSFTNVKVFRIRDFVRIEKAQAAVTAERRTAPKEKPVVAVADFENHGLEDHELSLIMDLYAESLLATGKFRVLERKELLKVMKEQGLQLSDITDSQTAVKISRLLNASYLATGSCGRLGTEYVITLKLLNAESGESVTSVKSNFKDPAEIPRRLNSLVRDMASKL